MENLFSPGVAATLMAPHELPEGVASLSRGAYFKEASLDMTLSILTESAAQMAGVERVSIWALTHDHEELRCLELFERSAGRHSSGGVLSASQYPAYFRALRSENCITADDPGRHPSTFEFSADYLTRHQVSAILITPIHIRGELQGTLCLEQVGPRQPWTPAHQLFAHAVANLVTLALVEFEAGQAKQQAQTANERLQAVFDASRDAMLLADADSGIILDANREAEKLFGFPRRQLVGKHRQALHPQGYSAAGQCLQGRPDQASVQQVCDIQRADGAVAKVEVSAEVADLSDGRRLLLGIFRPA